MNKLETYTLKQNRYFRPMVDIFTNEKKAVIFEIPNPATDFDEILELVSLFFLNVFIAKENGEVCSIAIATKKNIFS